jgi:uncharacterized membrane protein
VRVAPAITGVLFVATGALWARVPLQVLLIAWVAWVSRPRAR